MFKEMKMFIKSKAMKAKESPETYPIQFKDKIDEYLWKEHHILGGCCSSIEEMKYSVAREVAEKLTDAFLIKALKWYCLDCECNDNCNALHNCFFKSEFKRYLEGADNALPPKFKNALNPDGSTSDNYRYRHFIGVMKDKFIEKACKWFNNSSISDYLSGEMIEDFKRFIKSDE